MIFRYLFFILFSCSVYSQQIKAVDFKSVSANLSFKVNDKTVLGKVKYEFDVLNKIDTITIDAKKMHFSNLTLNGVQVDHFITGKKLGLLHAFEKGSYVLAFDYEVTAPKQSLYFVGDYNTDDYQIWTQGQGKDTSYWFPSFDDANEKLVFNLNITFDAHYQVISNGKLISSIKNNDLIEWHYSMSNPMSSYLLMMAIGKFDKKIENSKSGIPMHLYIGKNDTNKFESTYRFSKQIFDFLENEIQVNYPWEVYQQVPVRDFLYGGMENTTATIFSNDYVVDSVGFNDRNYVNVNAHELAHQWFGDLVTAENSNHHWLQEGFATYYALLAEKNVFGEDYFNLKLYKNALQLHKASLTDTIPVMNEKASTLTFYQKGAWVLHVLRENVGENNFRLAVKNYLEKYKFKNVNTDLFLDEVKKVSPYNVDLFKEKWLESPGFDIDEATSILSKSKLIKSLIDLKNQKKETFETKKKMFVKLLKSKSHSALKTEVVYQLERLDFETKKELLTLALQTNDLQVHKAIAETLTIVPENFKLEYASLLDDNSYITKEIVLTNLWKQFPGYQKDVLTKTQDWVGFNDKNLRILWLTLALGTKDFNNEDKTKYYDELLKYCSSEYEANVRQNAIENLVFLNPSDVNYLPYLVNGLTHHKWQFSSFCKEKIRLLIKNNKIKEYFVSVLPNISESERVVLSNLLQ